MCPEPIGESAAWSSVTKWSEEVKNKSVYRANKVSNQDTELRAVNFTKIERFINISLLTVVT